MKKITQNFYRTKTTGHRWLTTLCLTVSICLGVVESAMSQVTLIDETFNGTGATLTRNASSATGSQSGYSWALSKLYTNNTTDVAYTTADKGYVEFAGSANASWLQVPDVTMYNGGNVSFWVASGSTGKGFKLQSFNGTAWVDEGAVFTLTTSKTMFQVDRAITGTGIEVKKFRVIATSSASSGLLRILITTNAQVSTWTTAWSNGTPSSTVEAVIDGTYSGAGFDAKKLTVNSGKSLTITSGNLTVQNEVVNNGTLTIENNTNLVQVNNVANTGNVTVKRNSSALSRLDYTLWSSPVASQNLSVFSPLTSLSPNRFYTYNTATNLYAETADPTVTNFAPGAGYLIRMPNTAVTAPATETFNGQFTGVPNNGDILVTMTDGGAGFRYNLVGNPYPSPITMSSFVTDNANITGTLYFWRKTNGTGTAYCTWTAGTFTSNGNAQSVNPAGIIQTGQGFIVEANGLGTSLTFKNTQRSNNTTGQFFRTKQTAAADKVWLNATNTAGDFSQTAVTYSADGTTGADALDGKYINDSAFALTSNINNEEYTIQGRPSFDSSDVVPLNFKTAVAGEYTIAVDHAEGVFATGQDVYLVDSTTGAETNLKSGSYTFTAPAGTANSRFSLKYQKTLGVNDAVFNDNSVTVYRSKGIIYINSGLAVIANVKVYDIQGRLLAELKDVKSASASVNNLKAVNQVLVVKVTAEDGTVVTKKVVN